MIKFNWNKLNNYFKWNPSEVFKYFYYLSGISIPAHIGKLSRRDKNLIMELNKSTDKYSFLINPYPLLLRHSNVTTMYEYVRVASLRSLFDYQVRGVDWVYTWQITDNIDLNNPLFVCSKDRIYLKYDSNLTGVENGKEI